MHIQEVYLLTHRLTKVKDFYTRILGLPLLQETATQVQLQAGTTRLVFSQGEDGTHPFYHFAFNIPENKLSQAKEWARSQQLLLSSGEIDEIDHGPWNAQSIYFYDPAGNIAEFIARHNLHNGSEGDFCTKDILCISEIGLVVDHVLDTVDSLEIALDEQTWYHRSEQFSSLGNDHGLLIIAKRERVWLMTDKKAKIYPTRVVVQGKRSEQYNFEALPYFIHVIAANDPDAL